MLSVHDFTLSCKAKTKSLAFLQEGRGYFFTEIQRLGAEGRVQGKIAYLSVPVGIVV